MRSEEDQDEKEREYLIGRLRLFTDSPEIESLSNLALWALLMQLESTKEQDYWKVIERYIA